MLVNLDYQECEIQEDITIEVKPLETLAYQKVMGFLKDNGFLNSEKLDEKTKGKKAQEAFSKPEVFKLMQEILPDHCQNLKGVRVKLGGEERDATIEDLVKHGAFMTLCINILVKVFTTSSLTPKEIDSVKKDQPALPAV